MVQLSYDNRQPVVLVVSLTALHFGFLGTVFFMHDDSNSTPLWGWAIILAVLAMFVALIVKTLSTGG